jgi:hypothetical protein
MTPGGTLPVPYKLTGVPPGRGKNGQQSSPANHLGAEHRDENKIGFGFM